MQPYRILPARRLNHSAVVAQGSGGFPIGDFLPVPGLPEDPVNDRINGFVRRSQVSSIGRLAVRGASWLEGQHGYEKRTSNCERMRAHGESGIYWFLKVGWS
ncbi:MAG: hypothetical protein KJT03_12815, partial [Verrucomicrobiae bacterium]|nr:hypothetical protein [Verrucomicrobiae bacterium]